MISVADTGIGIDEENLDRVFQRFWRADDARHRSSGGLGIGLAVVKEIVERHGGSIGAVAAPQRRQRVHAAAAARGLAAASRYCSAGCELLDTSGARESSMPPRRPRITA